MQKFTLLACSLCAIVAMGIGFTSCKDDEPFVKPNLSVKTETITVAESGGTVQVEFVLDKGAPGDITIEYELGGTATSPADYSVSGTEGKVEIANGETSGVLQIQIVADAIYEGTETIEISIEDVSSTDVVITNDDETEVTITDDDPQVTLSMATAALTLSEDQTEYVVEINLNGATLAQPVTIGYTFSGSAVDPVRGAAQQIPIQFWDFVDDVENSGELVIPAGATKGEIPLVIFSDFNWEPDGEEIIITLNDASNGAQISTTNNKITITVEEQDGKVLALVWDSPTNTGVDMDLFLWDVGADPDDLLTFSANASTTEQVEVAFIPSIYEEGSLGASYVYYAGTVASMQFEAHFADYVDGTLEAEATRDIFSGTYTLANINKWDVQGAAEPAVVQTFQLNASGVTNISTPITIPATGSRMATPVLPRELKKTKFAMQNLLKRLK